jgi:hypothetical protein
MHQTVLKLMLGHEPIGIVSDIKGHAIDFEDVPILYFRKKSIQDDPIPSPEPLRLSTATSVEDSRKVRTILHQDNGAIRGVSINSH